MPHVILDKPHTHAGVLYAIGAELKVLEHEAYLLVKNGIAHLKGSRSQRSSAPSSSAAPPPLPAESSPEPTATSTDPVDTGAAP